MKFVLKKSTLKKGVRGLLFLTLLNAQVLSLFAAPKAKAKDLLFIAIDDLNDWVNYLEGHPQSITPNLDRLRKMGMNFTNCQTTAPFCGPSRVALMTGISPATSGIYENKSAEDFQGHSPILKDYVSIPHYFQQHNYKAIGSGKIFHGHIKEIYAEAFQEYSPSLDLTTKWKNNLGDDSKKIVGGAELEKLKYGKIAFKEANGKMLDEKTTDWVVNKILQKDDQARFIACGIYKPHNPLAAPQKYFDKFPLEKIILPKLPAFDDLKDLSAAGQYFSHSLPKHEDVISGGHYKALVQAYLACIHFADEQVGKVLDALEKSGNMDNTIIVLWSDHGYHLGEKHHWRKHTLWEEATRVPMMIVAPGITKAGTQSSEPVSLLDLYPTIVELANLPPNPKVEGKSLVPLLRNPAKKDMPNVYITYERGNHAIKTDDLKYIKYRDGSEELYNLKKDPNEWYNLICDPSYSTVLISLRDEMKEILKREAKNQPPRIIAKELADTEYEPSQPTFAGKINADLHTQLKASQKPATLTVTEVKGDLCSPMVYQWQERVLKKDGSYTAWSNIKGATQENYTPPLLKTSHKYRRQVKYDGILPSWVSTEHINISVVLDK